MSKIAQRFPVKYHISLLLFILFTHFSFGITAYLTLSFAFFMIIFFSLLVSFYYSWKQIKCITEAPDDLCWTGNKWCMNSLQSTSSMIHLDLLPSSWITSSFCFLIFSKKKHFYAQNGFLNKLRIFFPEQKIWFFSIKTLGKNLYSELCYLTQHHLYLKKSNGS
jgi:hypothetical protein